MPALLRLVLLAALCTACGPASRFDPGLEGPMGGTPCGPRECPSGQVCCNASCGICTPPGGLCTQQVCGAVICTQRFHLARSIYLARAAGLDAVGLVADRRPYASARRDAVREAIARAVALADVHLLGTAPTHLGPPLPVTGDARATHDKAAQRPDAR